MIAERCRCHPLGCSTMMAADLYQDAPRQIHTAIPGRCPQVPVKNEIASGGYNLRGTTHFFYSMPYLLLCCMLMSLPVHAADSRAQLFFGQWSVQTPMGTAGGPVLCLVEQQRSWRLDFLVDSGDLDKPVEDLLKRRGEGWTLAGGQNGGFSQPWHQPWRQLSSTSTAAMHELILMMITDQNHQEELDKPTPRRWRRPLPERDARITIADWRDLIVLPDRHGRDADPMRSSRGDLRRRSVIRGLGRGGEDLCLNLRRNGPRVVLSTARWPGSLVIMLKEERRMVVPTEAFLPLWPVADFLL
jgi:hypothetical protein